MPRKMHEGKARPKSSVAANTAPHGGEAPVIKGKGRAVQAPQRAAGSGEVLNFEAKLWSMADQLRGAMDASEYKHPVLGLIFLKYISDAFEELHAELASDPESDAEDRDEYTARNIFWVPAAARWSQIAASAKSPQIGEIVDTAMIEIERDNPRLRGVLPKEYAKPSLGSTRLGAIVDLVNGIGLGNAEARKHDVIGRVYEYFLGRFANAEGKAGGEFYTPRPVVRLLVEAIEPYKGRVFDPCCGSGGMFVQSEQFVLAHGGKIGDVSIYGQESNHTTWRLAMMNLAIRGIEAHIEWNEGGSFLQDAFPDLKADFILANPPFNDSEWGGQGLRDDKRWKFGIPPAGNSNYAWIEHFVHHLAPTGVAAFVMANGSMSSNQSGEGEIRRNLIEAEHGGLVDCVIALPGQLFYTTQIPVCVWILARHRRNHKFRDRTDEVLFIDARKMGEMTDRTHKTLRDEDIAKIAGVYHAWRGKDGGYADVPGFCKAATLEEVRKHGHVLTPGRYVGTEELEDDGEPFAEKMARLTGLLREQQAAGAELDSAIAANLRGLGFWP
uniref:site-specific DNA-methyltransferase (adenine-specific) n=1 Tax=mine drainage metagenome TaxID=410659 RepID=E6PF33_9ZZZZ